MITDTQYEEFLARGFLQIRGFVDAATMRRVQDETARLHDAMARQAEAEHKPGRGVWLSNGVHVAWEERDDVRRIRQLMNSERVSPAIREVQRSARMLGVIRRLIGHERIINYHSKLLMKSARDGSFTPWHQDWGYWRHSSKEPTQVNCMLAIDPATVENGCIRFVVGSQKQGAVDHADLASASFNIGLPGGLDQFANEPVESEPGDAVFFGSLVIHGSGANTSAQDRRANTFAFDQAGNFLKADSPEELL